jgi:hypothetical protein
MTFAINMPTSAGEALGFGAKVLAVVGGAVLGAWLVGLAVRLLVKALSGQTVPNGALMVVRLLAAVACGWLVAILLFGGTGTGWGFFGGGGNGKDGTAKNKDQDTPGPKDEKKTPDDKKPKDEQKTPQPPLGDTLYVEVFDVNGLRAIDAPVPSDKELNDVSTRRVYRLRDRPDRMLSINDVEEIIEGQKGPPVRYVKAVLYDVGSPVPAHQWVKELLDRVRSLPVKGEPDKKIVATDEQALGKTPAPLKK